MSIAFEDVSETLRHIQLGGRLDIPGTEAISLKFTNLTASATRRIVVDLRGVDFLASIGIRELIANAKALQMRGSRMVLLVAGGTAVAKTLNVTGIDTLIPLFTDPADADRAALA